MTRFPRSLALLFSLVSLLVAFPGASALFWDPIPLPPSLVNMKVYRLATDGRLLFAGGTFAGYGFYTDVESVSADGVTFELIPNLPLPGVSLSYAGAEGGRLSKLVRISDDRAPRIYMVATFDTATRSWSTGGALTLTGEQSPGSLAVLGRIPYIGTTAGDLWAENGGAWGLVTQELPLSSAPYHPAPRIVRAGDTRYVVSDRGLGKLVQGKVVSADVRLAGRTVMDVVAQDDSLLVLSRSLRGDGRAVVERFGPASVTQIAALDAADSRGFLFVANGDVYVAGPFNEPRLLSQGVALSPRASRGDGVAGFRVTTGDGVPIEYLGAFITTAKTVLYRSRSRVQKTIPAIVDAGAPGGGRYRTELLLGNYGPDRGEAVLSFHPDAGLDPSLASLRVALPPGSEVRIGDAAEALRNAGAARPGTLTGSLSIEFTSVDPFRTLSDSDLFASARVLTTTAQGTFGVTLPALPAGAGIDSEAGLSGPGQLPGVIRDEATRTNIAVVNAANGNGASTASCGGVCGRVPSLKLFDSAGALSDTLTFALAPGARKQWNGIVPGGASKPALVSASVRAVPPGGASWDAQLGDDVFVYAVLNDAVTNDGVYLPLQTPSRDARRDRLFLATVGDFAGAGGNRHRSTLLLAQALETPGDATLLTFQFRGQGAEGSVDISFDETIRAGESRRIEDVPTWIRSHRGGPPGPPVFTGDLIGTLSISARSGAPVSGIVATNIVITTREGIPGRAMTSLDALAESRWAGGSCIVPGLIQNPTLRSAVALSNPEPNGGLSARLGVELHDARSGALLGAPIERVLRPGERIQLDDVLDGAGLPSGTQAYARVVSRGETGSRARFVAYGVTIERDSGDGSVTPMTEVR